MAGHTTQCGEESRQFFIEGTSPIFTTEKLYTQAPALERGKKKLFSTKKFSYYIITDTNIIKTLLLWYMIE